MLLRLKPVPSTELVEWLILYSPFLLEYIIFLFFQLQTPFQRRNLHCHHLQHTNQVSHHPYLFPKKAIHLYQTFTHLPTMLNRVSNNKYQRMLVLVTIIKITPLHHRTASIILNHPMRPPIHQISWVTILYRIITLHREVGVRTKLVTNRSRLINQGLLIQIFENVCNILSFRIILTN